MRYLKTAVLGAVLATMLFGGVASARGDSNVGFLIGYGYVKQTRLDAASEGHLFSIGIHTGSEVLEEGLFGAFTFDFVIDHVYEDLTQLSLAWEFGYAFGGRNFAGYFGGAIRSGIDGYSGGDTPDNADSSWSPLDPGAVLGMVALLGGYGIGAEARGWLGWNFYEDGDNAIEPYFDARVYMSLLF